MVEYEESQFIRSKGKVMISTTILKPTWDKARAAKTYALDEQRRPTISSTYSLGKTFTFACPTFADIAGFHDLLQRCTGHELIRIAGTPVPQLHGVVDRKKENFADGGTRILLLDADDWPVPDGHHLRDTEGIRATVQEIVRLQGFTFLKDAQFCVLLSSSFWDVNMLRAHIYYLLDEAVPLADLHAWGLAYNSLNPTYKLDYSLFRQVQPDFISKRICQGFQDPLPDSHRLTMHCDHLTPYVRKVDLSKHMTETLTAAGMVSTTSVVGATIGSTWERTLELCGSAQHGINDPAYRACAQLVQEVGNNAVKDNLGHYTDKVFSLLWQAVKAHGVRGNRKDREYYNRARLRGYIASALQKSFGANTDGKLQNIAAAIQQVIGGSSPSLLFDADILEDFRYLRSKLPGKWAEVRTIVKSKLKGKVEITAIEKALKLDTTSKDIARMIEEIIGRFEWIEGSIDQGLYCKRKTGDNYNLVSMDGGLESDIYTLALDMFADGVPMNFEKSVMKVLVSRSRDKLSNQFMRAPVESRVYSHLMDSKHVLYYNLGVSQTGDMYTARIDEHGFKIQHSSEAPVVWSTDRGILPAVHEDPRPMKNFMGDNTEKYYIDTYLKGMRSFTSVEDDEALIDLMAWQVVAAMNTGTATLLEITGASGDGKSHTALFAKELVDPTSTSLRDGPDLHNGLYKKEDLAKVLRARHVTIIDNLSNLRPTEQDLLCSVATGWKYDLRIMYTQQFLKLVIKKPVVMTSLAPIITNQDLRSRSISVSVTRSKKLKNGDIYELWDKEKPAMFTGFMYLVSDVIARVNRMRASGESVNIRDLWGECARAVLMRHMGYCVGPDQDAKIMGLIASRKTSRDVDEALLNSKTSLLILWVLNSQEFINKKMVNITTPEAFSSLQAFAFERAGVVLAVKGVKIKVQPSNLPKTARGLGILLGKYRNDIYSVTEWDVQQQRSSFGRGWCFTKGRSF